MFKDELIKAINNLKLEADTERLLLDFIKMQEKENNLETGTFILGIIKILAEIPLLKAKAAIFDEIVKLQETTEKEINGYEKQIEQLELAIDPPQVG